MGNGVRKKSRQSSTTKVTGSAAKTSTTTKATKAKKATKATESTKGAKNTRKITKDHGNREVKSSVFSAYFGESKNAAALYDSIAGTSGTRPEDIQYETLDGVLFMARKNDLSFIANGTVLVISEHQSTINENMPLRDLIYLARNLEKLIDQREIYKRKMIKIPTPEFYVFYNGVREYPLEKEMHLSDAYLMPSDYPMADLTVKIININKEKDHEILKKCQPMNEYATFMSYIRQYKKEQYNNEASITLAIEECRKLGIMTEFLRKHGSEVENMILTQWNWDDAMEVAKEEMREDLIEEVRKEILEKEQANFDREQERANREKARADAQEARADAQEARADAQEARADAQEARANKAEEELRRLKEEFGIK